MNSARFATEHILEFQLIKHFFDEMQEKKGAVYDNPKRGGKAKVGLCSYMQGYWNNAQFSMDSSGPRRPMDFVGQVFPGMDNQYVSEFVILDSGINAAKEGVSFPFSLSHCLAASTVQG